MEKITYYPCEGRIIELKQREKDLDATASPNYIPEIIAKQDYASAPITQKVSKLKPDEINPIVNSRKRLSPLERFAEETSNFIDAITHGKNKQYLKNKDVSLIETYLKTYIDELNQINKVDAQEMEEEEDSPSYQLILKQNEKLEKDQLEPEDSYVAHTFADYLKEEKREPTLEYLRENLTYDLANQLMSFVTNSDKTFNHSSYADRINLIKLMRFKVNILMEVLPNSYELKIKKHNKP